MIVYVKSNNTLMLLSCKKSSIVSSGYLIRKRISGSLKGEDGPIIIARSVCIKS